MNTSNAPDPPRDAAELLTAINAAWRALHPRSGASALHLVALEAEVHQLFGSAVSIMGQQVKALFRPYQLPEGSRYLTGSKTLSPFEVQALVACLERLACYVRMKKSEPAQPDLVVNELIPR